MNEPHNTDQGGVDPEDAQWVRLARDAFTASTTFLDSSLRQQIERNLAMFRSKHPAGSKYHGEAYRYRSKIFRPKTRSTIRRHEAAAAMAFFATADAVHIEAEDDNNERQQVSAAVNSELVNYRLDKTIPWFLTLIGAYQDAMTAGAVISKQHWVYEEGRPEYRQRVDEHGRPALDEGGQPLMEEVPVVKRDEPAIDLIPFENLRFDPAAEWTDPMGTSPYVIHLVPMYVCDVKERMRRNDPKTGKPQWRVLDDGAIKSAMKQDADSTRRAREGEGRQDSTEKEKGVHVGDFDVVWVHENIIRKDGDDWVYFTMGTDHLLTDPKPLDEVYFHGERPFVMGYCVVEAHRAPPSGLPELWDGLQTEANDIANQRLDNVKLVLNTRYFADRKANVDYRALTRSVPGGVVLTDQMDGVKADRPGDVTGSSYQEQDRINVDFDELAGTFSNGSVQSNRSLNETVGGMELMAGDASAVTDYQLRVFTETWVQPVLRQLVKLEQAYETDEVVLALAGQRAKLFQRYGIDAVTDDLLQGELTTRVNVGFGATNPERRVQKLVQGLSALGQVHPQSMMMVDGQEVRNEIFGALGYKDGARFFVNADENPQMAQMQQQIQQLQQALQSKEMELQNKLQVEDMRQQGRLAEARLKGEIQMQIERMKSHLEMIDKQLEQERNDIERGKLMNQREALLHQMRTKEEELLQRNQQARESQTLMNGNYGGVPGSVG